MAEPFKNMFRPETVRELAGWLTRGGPFDSDGFIEVGLQGLETLELKARVQHLAVALVAFLPKDFPDAAAHIAASLPPPLSTDDTLTSGFLVWPLCRFAENQGLEDPETALPLLRELTRRFTAEFAIRPFLLRDPDGVIARLAVWATDPDMHVRRLVSEGTRPRLPWGVRLGIFVDEPSPLIPLLDGLKADPELYVRRSVANNLNDISKDNPDVVVGVLGRWGRDPSPETAWLTRHALRTLIKQGHPEALALLGYKSAAHLKVVHFSLSKQVLKLGESVELRLELSSSADIPDRLMIDYRVYHMKANGKLAPKTFKWTAKSIAKATPLSLKKNHTIRPITTRKYYPGLHEVHVQINGNVVAQECFTLQMDGAAS